MKVLITGRDGQVGWELERSAPDTVEMQALDRSQLDITDAGAVERYLGNFKPDVVINAAAYTAVDKAETDAESAYAVNRDGARNLAQACRDLKSRLIHISTDFVFDGERALPYQPHDATAPTGVYGMSKLAGEQAVRELLPDSSLIVRTAWVYSVHGNNFVKTILRLIKEKPLLGVVYDQIGTPTWARSFARVLWCAAERTDVNGTLHWTDAGVTSWYDFAVAIQELSLEKGLLANKIPVKAIPATSYPTPACRPHYSVLDKTATEEQLGINAEHWQQELGFMLDDLNSFL